MKTITDNWPTVRKLIYAAVGVVCGGLVLAGVLTEAQSVTYLAYIGSGLGALGAILASVNINKPVETPVVVAPPIDAGEIANQVAQQLNYGVRQAQTQVTQTVADLRKQAEQAFGEYR